MKKLIFMLCLGASFTAHALTMPTFYGELKKVVVGKATISYYRFGQGKPLVMVPGHGDSMTTWSPVLLKQLSQKRELILFDYPGVGESSTQGAYPETMSQFSQLVRQFIKSQQLETPDVLGFSMGGSVLLFLAAQDASQLGHLIVVGGKAGGTQTVLPKAKYFIMLSNPKLSPEQAVKTLLFPKSAVKQADSYLKALAEIPQEKMSSKALKAQGRAVSAENRGPGVWARLSDIKNKVMIVNGTEDVLTPVENAEKIAVAIEDSWLVRIKGAGHGVLFQMPKYSAHLIELFLNY